MKKLLVVIVILLVSIPLAHGQATAQIVMKLGHFAADSHPGNLASKMFAEGVEKRTNGQIKVTIYPNNALGSPPEVLEQNILGAVDMSLPTQGQLGKYSKKFNCVMLPFAFKDYAQADKVLDGPFLKWAVPDLDKAGLVFLSNWEWGFRNLTNSKRPVKVPADVKGLKIRTPPELPTQAAMEALGAVVATINFNELQMALKQGVVDGQENPIAVIYSNKIYETQKYLTMTGHNYNTMVHVISKKTWDKLTPEQQKIVREANISLYYKGFNESALADVVIFTIDRMREVQGKKAIIMLSTGLDTFSKKTYDDALKAAATSETVIYAVSMGQLERTINEPLYSTATRSDLLMADLRLKSITKKTGGIAFFPRFSSEYPSVFRNLNMYLRYQYTMAYTPTNQKLDNKNRKIRVEAEADINRDGKPDKLKVSHKESYKAVEK